MSPSLAFLVLHGQPRTRSRETDRRIARSIRAERRAARHAFRPAAVLAGLASRFRPGAR